MTERVLVFDASNEDHANRFAWLYRTYVRGQGGAASAEVIARNVRIITALDNISVKDETAMPWEGMDEARVLQNGVNELVLSQSDFDQMVKFVDTGKGTWNPFVQARQMVPLSAFLDGAATRTSEDTKVKSTTKRR